MSDSIDTSTNTTNNCKSKARRLARNAAVKRCLRAWQYAYNKKLANLAEDDTEWDAQKAGNLAYLRAIPTLDGYLNICDFIACVTYAEVNDLIMRREAHDFLAAANIALRTVSREPAPQNSEPKRRARPRKNPEAAENN